MSRQEETEGAWPIVAPNVDFLPVGPWNTDGLIAVLPFVQPWQSRYFEQLLADDFPVVFAGTGQAGPSVTVDNRGGIMQALAHLVSHGHQHIAFIAGRPERMHGDSVERYRAYEAALKRFDLPFNPDLVAYGEHQYESGRRAMADILDRGAPFTAVLASNDAAASGAMETLRQADVRVPQDVAVIGFDDRLQAQAQIPPLTTVHHPAFELGYQALNLLTDYVKGHVTGNRTLTVPTRLVIRESCGCTPGAITHRNPDQAPVCTLLDDEENLATPTAAKMARAVRNETQNLSFEAITELCEGLHTAWQAMLDDGNANRFIQTVYRTLHHVLTEGANPSAWQNAITVLREDYAPSPRDRSEDEQANDVEAACHQARIAISKAAQVQNTRWRLYQTEQAEEVGQMTASLFGAKDESEIYARLEASLPISGIEAMAIVLYEPEADDPVAWSQTPWSSRQASQRFPTRTFPPQTWYENDEAFQLALVPMVVRDDLRGFCAFRSEDLEPLAAITRQLTAALREVWLYRQALEGRRLAEEANRLKSRFLSMVSHELRTPINLITGLSDLLLKEGEDETSERISAQREDIKRIYTTGQHLDSLIRDVLDLASSEVNQLKLTREPLDMTDVLETIGAIGKRLTAEQGLAWHADIPEDLPLVFGDRARLRQVVLNLLNNAVKFTDRGEVALTARHSDAGVTVTLRDTGLGIPQDEQDVIFDEFRQSERTTARGCSGMGLGLAICKRIVEAHGGQIGVTSPGTEGAGSTFFFSIPILEETRQLEDEGIPLSTQRICVLLKDVARAPRLQRRLRQHGVRMDLSFIEPTDDWLRQIIASPPDTIMLDQQVTSEQGWDIIKVLKGNPATKAIPLLFFSLDQEMEQGALLSLDYMTKPMGTTELSQALERQGLMPHTGEAETTILIVDDDPQVLDMHAGVVTSQAPNYRVLRARSGRKALDIIRRERPDLILLDLMMPGLDGFGVLSAMRDEKMDLQTPVIVLTSKSLTQEDMKRLNQGMASVLSKGVFSAEETMAHIEAALAHTLKLDSEAHRIVLQATAYIHKHYGDSLNRDDIATSINVSNRHLNRCFKETLGITPITYLNRYRIKEAKHLLETTQQSITNIGLQVGFSSGGYFTRVFKQETGVAPSTYKQRTHVASEEGLE
jgi:signal transduction histidine kinase/DNA-binding response OmpR family regulator